MKSFISASSGDCVSSMLCTGDLNSPLASEESDLARVGMTRALSLA
jgi:hypothetical protein|tara:strand:- start:77 stop:214 length:138 start_codon:yes stop_codon:yes gene_type:complete